MSRAILIILLAAAAGGADAAFWKDGAANPSNWATYATNMATANEKVCLDATPWSRCYARTTNVQDGTNGQTCSPTTGPSYLAGNGWVQSSSDFGPYGGTIPTNTPVTISFWMTQSGNFNPGFGVPIFSFGNYYIFAYTGGTVNLCFNFNALGDGLYTGTGFFPNIGSGLAAAANNVGNQLSATYCNNNNGYTTGLPVTNQGLHVTVTINALGQYTTYLNGNLWGSMNSIFGTATNMASQQVITVSNYITTASYGFYFSDVQVYLLDMSQKGGNLYGGNISSTGGSCLPASPPPPPSPPSPSPPPPPPSPSPPPSPPSPPPVYGATLKWPGMRLPASGVVSGTSVDGTYTATASSNVASAAGAFGAT